MTNDRDHTITICAAFGCCEPGVTDFCDRHARELRMFDLWLHDALPIGRCGEVLRAQPDDRRSSFGVARGQWDDKVQL